MLSLNRAAPYRKMKNNWTEEERCWKVQQKKEPVKFSGGEGEIPLRRTLRK